LIYNLN